MAKKIIKVEDEPKKKKKSNIDLKKIGRIIVDNKSTINKAIDMLGNSLDKKSSTKTTKKSTKKSTSKKNSSGVDVTDLIGNLLKK